ncbi:MAG: 5'-methylthioadenosine/S-adenosylhomocysteine nucleosidase [Verrucomicrobiota bacterium]
MKKIFRLFAVFLLIFPNLLRGDDLIAVVSAYQGELDSVFALLGIEKIERTETINGVEFTFARAHGKDLVLFKTNVSTVNAAMTTQLALSNFEIDLLLFSGVAGGINPDLKKGDLSIPDRWMYHAEGVYANQGFDPRDRNPGRLHAVEPFGIFYPGKVRVARAGQPQPVMKADFSADPDLLELAERALGELELSNAHGEPARVKIGGVGMTGPVFLDNREYRKWLFREFKADCLEMESASIAHVCWANHVPFLIVRSMSDLAGGQEGENEIAAFAKQAEDNSARAVAAILSAF